MRRLVSVILTVVLLATCSGCFWERGRGGYGEHEREGYGDRDRGGHDDRDRGGHDGDRHDDRRD